jgi:hypothetical protein
MAFKAWLSFLIFHNNHFIRRIYRVDEFFYNPYSKLLDYKKGLIGAIIFGGIEKLYITVYLHPYVPLPN